MSQSLSVNLIHLIYSTKNRVACLTPDLLPDLFGYQAGIFKDMNSPAIEIGGAVDHVHALFVLSKNHKLCDIIEEVKKGSSRWLKTQGAGFSEFHWQGGYGAFSVSQSHVEKVREYILTQEEHHRTITFQDEFRKFLKRYNVEYDERYVWD
jgi:putative transposase